MTIHRRPLLLPVYILAVLSVMLMYAPDVAQAAPKLIAYQGRLTDSLGYPVPDSSYAAVFAVYSNATDGSALWQENTTVVARSGLFDHLLGSVTPFPGMLFRDYDSLYLQVTIGNGVVMPRTRLASVPYALVAQEAFNEPGIAVNTNVSLISLPTGSMTDLVTVDITTPTDGYLVLHGKCYLLLSGTTGPNTALVQIDENEGGGSSFPYYTVAGLGGYVNTATNYFPVYVTRTYYRTAGTYTFRMEGRASYSLPAEAKSWDHILTAIFYPTSYEAVRQISSEPGDYPAAVPINIDGSVNPGRSGTYYEIDLRYYERQAKAARKAQKAGKRPRDDE